MKFLFLSTLLLTFVFCSWSYVLDPFTTLHFSADNQLDAGEFYQAKIDCESILKLQPCLFRQSANSKIGETHIRAAQDLAGTTITLFRDKLPGVPTYVDWLATELPSGATVGYDGAVMSYVDYLYAIAR